jgi:cyclase
VINTFAVEDPSFIRTAADEFGSSTITVCIDVKKKIFGKQQVYIYGGSKSTSLDPVSFAIMMGEMGAGELIINSIDRDGSMEGYDIELIKTVSDSVTIPVVALGGAGKVEDLNEAVQNGHASAVAAGSMFVFHGPRRAVLINYPQPEELKNIFK